MPQKMSDTMFSENFSLSHGDVQKDAVLLFLVVMVVDA
jgi:hypothetical protein